jgi:hypothetical protein
MFLMVRPIPFFVMLVAVVLYTKCQVRMLSRNAGNAQWKFCPLVFINTENRLNTKIQKGIKNLQETRTKTRSLLKGAMFSLKLALRMRDSVTFRYISSALKPITILQTFCESRMRTAETDFDAIDRLTRLLDTCEREEKRQRQITDFFKQGQ